tara:strand:- start:234 stop:467 length:234 start_codon:yes stop_codon:yes gene_type:complete
MTNQFPDATKMVLSPAAQAILNAYGRETGDIDCVWHLSELKGLAAVLRALAMRINGADDIRQDVLDIVAELEALPNA